MELYYDITFPHAPVLTILFLETVVVLGNITRFLIFKNYLFFLKNIIIQE